jgi:hypothetical protein
MRSFFLYPLVLAILWIPLSSSADLGPKPSFYVFFDDSIAAVSKVDLLTCEKSTCEDQTPFKEFGPQRFDCGKLQATENRSCFVMAYGFSPFLKLKITTKGKVYETVPFSPDGNVNIALLDDQLMLTKQSGLKTLCFWCSQK